MKKTAPVENQFSPEMEKEILSLTSGELQSLLVFIEKRIELAKAEEKQKAIEVLCAQAKELGFSLNELVGSGTIAKKPAPQKYRNPENPIETWSGRGRKPLWVVKQLEGGKSLDDLRI